MTVYELIQELTQYRSDTIVGFKADFKFDTKIKYDDIEDDYAYGYAKFDDELICEGTLGIEEIDKKIYINLTY